MISLEIDYNMVGDDMKELIIFAIKFVLAIVFLAIMPQVVFAVLMTFFSTATAFAITALLFVFILIAMVY